MAPLTRNNKTLHILSILLAATVVVQSLYGPAAWWVSCVNCAIAAAMAFFIVDILSEYRLGTVKPSVTFLTAWIAMTAASNFATLYMPSALPYWQVLVSEAGMLMSLHLMLGSWQRTQAPFTFLATGGIIGALSTLQPFALGWLLLVFPTVYHMRSSSVRNWSSLLTGVVLGVWVVYCLTWLVSGEQAADDILPGYAALGQILSPELPDLTWAAWVFVGLFVVLLAIYTVTSLVLSIGSTIRARACVVLISTISILLTLITLTDLQNLQMYVCLLSIFLALQLAVHLANVYSAVNEWWTIVLLVVLMLLGVLPVVME